MAQQIIIKGTPVVAANEVLVADSNSKIPAVDGSAVTTMAGGNITGTIPTARLDTGTTANKVVVVGASGLPAVDGSLLTGIVSYTKSASDPTLSTNPSTGVGTEWVNHTTGKQFICTDATAGENVWTCSGGGSGNVAPFYGHGDSYGYSAINTQIDKYSHSSDSNAVAYGSGVTTAPSVTAVETGTSSSTHGYMTSFLGAVTGTIRKFSFASEGASTNVGNLTAVRTEKPGGTMSTTYGYTMGGWTPGGNLNTIDKYSYSTDGNATDVGDLTALMNGKMCTHDNNTTAWITGGTSGWTVIETMTFASDANGVDWADLMSGGGNGGQASTETYGFIMGTQGPFSTHIQRWAYASAANATDFGDVSTGGGRYRPSSSCSKTHGYMAGGQTSGWVSLNTIEKFAYDTGGTATDIADLTIAESGISGYQT
jgi:hypothetical protein